MKRLIVAAIVIALVFMAGCVEEPEVTTPTPTETPATPQVEEGTLRAIHTIELPAAPTKDDCIKCHRSILDNKPHTQHVSTLGFDCTTCHKLDEPLPEFKKLVPVETCTSCHPDYLK
jgi:hypothetical protein